MFLAALLLVPLLGVEEDVFVICRTGIWTIVYLWVSEVVPFGFLASKSKSDMGWSFWEMSYLFALVLS